MNGRYATGILNNFLNPPYFRAIPLEARATLSNRMRAPSGNDQMALAVGFGGLGVQGLFPTMRFLRERYAEGVKKFRRTFQKCAWSAV